MKKSKFTDVQIAFDLPPEKLQPRMRALWEAAQSQVKYNNHRPHSAIGYEVPATLMMSLGPSSRP